VSARAGLLEFFQALLDAAPVCARQVWQEAAYFFPCAHGARVIQLAGYQLVQLAIRPGS
jgi:hypothetical protein